jgi:hypothetical protein
MGTLAGCLPVKVIAAWWVALAKAERVGQERSKAFAIARWIHRGGRYDRRFLMTTTAEKPMWAWCLGSLTQKFFA